VPLDKLSKAYTEFATEFGLYEYNVLPMGVTSATATFQRLMIRVLGDLIGTCCLEYLDDIFIFSGTQAVHIRHLEAVVDRLERAILKVKLSKCELGETSLKFLGHIVGGGQIRPNPEKSRHCTAGLYQRQRNSYSASLD
jgi:hypothetical protein